MCIDALIRVSVVIPTYNRVRLLAECLASLEELNYQSCSFEVIVIDDGSTDTTVQFLTQFSKSTSLNFSYYSQTNRGPASARNLGIRQARGEYVAFTDDDCTVDPKWLEVLVGSFTADTVAGVGGAIRSRSPGLISDYMTLHNIIASNTEGTSVPPFLITANACYRKQALVDAGCFDESIKHPGGEDPDLSWRVLALGYSLESNSAAIIYHYHKTDILGFVRCFYHYGQGYQHVAVKHGLSQSKPSGRKISKKMLSPRVFLFGVRQYHIVQRLCWYRAVTFTFLDWLRELAWLRGSVSVG